MARLFRSDALLVAVVFLVAAAAVALLTWSAVSARGINDEAGTIANTADQIHSDTDSITQLRQTNQYAASVLAHARPLAPELNRAADTARSIDRHATSIRGSATGIAGSARTINGTAQRIDGSASEILGSARGINTRAAGILRIARVIRHDVALINLALNPTIRLARRIHADTGNIAHFAATARHLSACIDREVHGPRSAAGGCG